MGRKELQLGGNVPTHFNPSLNTPSFQVVISRHLNSIIIKPINPVQFCLNSRCHMYVAYNCNQPTVIEK